jgi:hypothetical protein
LRIVHRRAQNFLPLPDGRYLLTGEVFRGQLLELLRWAVRRCPAVPNGGNVFKDTAARTRLLQAT